MSGPTDLISKVHHLRQLGQGWSSRLLKRVLAHLLTDEAGCREVALARDEYAHRRAQFVAALAQRGVTVAGNSPYVRVAVGVLADQIEDIADDVADAACTIGWGNRAR